MAIYEDYWEEQRRKQEALEDAFIAKMKAQHEAAENKKGQKKEQPKVKETKMSAISEHIKQTILRRLSCALDISHVSSNDSANKSVKVAYMVYCSKKYGCRDNDDTLIKTASKIVGRNLSVSTIYKIKLMAKWMIEEIPNIKPNLSIQPKWQKITDQMETGYYKAIMEKLHPKQLKEEQESQKAERKAQCVVKKLTNDELKLLQCLETGDNSTRSNLPYAYLLDTALEKLRLQKIYNVWPRWIANTIFKALYKQEPTKEELRRITIIAQKIEAYFYGKKLPEAQIEKSLREEIEETVATWAAMSQNERSKASNMRLSRAKGRLPRAERNKIRAEQRDATKLAEKLNSQQREKYKEEHPFVVSHKIRLSLNNKQKTYLQKCFGVTRFTYNWMVSEWLRLRNEGERPSAYDMSARFNDIAATEYPWTYDVTHYARQTAYKSFENAFSLFLKTGTIPKHKKHGLGCGSLHYIVGTRKQPILSDYNPDIPDSKPSKNRQYLFVPGLGYVKMMERLRFNGLFTSIIVKRESGDQYFAVLRVYIDREEWRNTHKMPKETADVPVGIDLGIRDLAILSTGLKIDKHQTDKRLRNRKRELQTAIKHKKECHPGITTKKQKMMALQLAKTKARMVRQRNDYQHKVAAALAYTCRNICMEDLNIVTMLRSGDLPAHLFLEAALYHFRKLMEQKMEMAGHHLDFAPKGYQSTEICSNCGHQISDIELKQRVFRCDACGFEADRDVNAAVNLAKLIGLDGPESKLAAKGETNATLTSILTRNGITTHQAGEDEQAGT